MTNIQVEVLSTAPGPVAARGREVRHLSDRDGPCAACPGSTQLRSVSKFGLSVVTIVFEDGVDIYFARQLVLERLIEAKDKVPPGVEIAMGPVSTAMGEIYQYTLEGPDAGGRGGTGPRT